MVVFEIVGVPEKMPEVSIAGWGHGDRPYPGHSRCHNGLKTVSGQSSNQNATDQFQGQNPNPIVIDLETGIISKKIVADYP